MDSDEKPFNFEVFQKWGSDLLEVLTLLQKGLKLIDIQNKYTNFKVTDKEFWSDIYASDKYTKTLNLKAFGLPGGEVVHKFLQNVGIPPLILGSPETLNYNQITVDEVLNPVQKKNYPTRRPSEYWQFVRERIVLSSHIYKNDPGYKEVDVNKDPVKEYDDQKQKLSYSTAFFHVWSEYCHLGHYPNLGIDPNSNIISAQAALTKMRQLTYVLQYQVDNDVTQKIIEVVYGKYPLIDNETKEPVPVDVLRKWSRDDSQAGFQALLATPNSKWLGYMLTQYFDEFHLDIKAIHTQMGEDRWFYMCFTLGPF